MKKKLSSLIVVFFISLQYAAYAESPCVTAFALGYALAQAEYASDCEFCNNHAGPMLGPCLKEAQTKYNDAIHNVMADYSACCCAQELSCCN